MLQITCIASVTVTPCPAAHLMRWRESFVPVLDFPALAEALPDMVAHHTVVVLGDNQRSRSCYALVLHSIHQRVPFADCEALSYAA